jgi:uncharacterized OsmC-like protein
MPSAVILAGTALCGCLVKLGGEMARRMRITIPQVDVAATALAVISPHRQPQSMTIRIISNFKRCALAGVGLENIHARLAHR